MSVNGIVLRLGQTLGPIVIGFFYSAWGIEASFRAKAVIAVASGVVAWLTVYRTPEAKSTGGEAVDD